MFTIKLHASKNFLLFFEQVNIFSSVNSDRQKFSDAMYKDEESLIGEWLLRMPGTCQVKFELIDRIG